MAERASQNGEHPGTSLLPAAAAGEARAGGRGTVGHAFARVVRQVAQLAPQELEHEQTGLSNTFNTRVAMVLAGERYTWTARTHRRNKLLKDVASKHHPHLQPFTLFSIERIKAGVQNPVELLSFTVGPLFFVGSALFVVGCAGQTRRGYWTGQWSASEENDIVNIPFLVGALLFFLGCYACVIETANVHYNDLWHAWKASGEKGDPPRFRVHPAPTEQASKFVSYYGCLLQFLGSIAFLVGAITEVVGGYTAVSDDVDTWLLDVPFLVGGAFFVAGAYLLVSEGSHSWWRGCVPPLRRQELVSVDYWIGLTNWVGSLLFLAGATDGFLSDELTVKEFQIMTGLTWLAGSVVFTIQGAMLYLEFINPGW